MDRTELALHKAQIEKLVRVFAADQFNVCARCILRYCNVRHVFASCRSSSYDQVVSDLISVLSPEDASAIEAKLNGFCSSCLNVLADSFASEKSDQIYAKVKENGFDGEESFQLQILLPVALTLRNTYFQKKLNLLDEEVMSIKELFKVLLVAKLKVLMNAELKSDSNFVIEVTFNHVEGNKECGQLVDISPETFFAKKCRKSSAEAFVNHSSVLRVINQLSRDSICQLKLGDIREECTISEILLKNEPLYIAGRYLKYSRQLSQTPWFTDGGAMIKSSVQERITSGVEKYISYKDIKFSSSGREDVDVRMLGRGRPFLLEILHPRLLTTEDTMNKIKTFINKSYDDVQVRDLQIVDRGACQKYLKEGEEDKTKTYQALCCLTRPYTEKDFSVVAATKDLVLTQWTPIRVLHRRTLSDRKRSVYKMWAEVAPVNELEEKYRPFADRIFKLNLTSEAGTYIKEFVHSDFGRTTPNLCLLLGNCEADIITLDVMEVNVNWPPTIDD